MIKINSNIIPSSINDFIENILKNQKFYTDKNIPQPFPFFYQKGMTSKNSSEINDIGFYNPLCIETENMYNFDYGPCMMNILYKVCSYYNIFIEKIILCRAFLQPPSKIPYQQELHTDLPTSSNSPFYSLIYYASDSDGDTVFFNQDTEIERVTPKKGRTVLFNGQIPHRGTKPITQTKVLLNFTFQGFFHN